MRTSKRRHNDEKILKRRLQTSKQAWFLKDDRFDGNERKRWQGIILNTGTICSCWMCRISRQYYGPSAQERRQVAWLEVE